MLSKQLLGLLTILLLFSVTGGPAESEKRRSHNVTTRGKNIQSCADIDIKFDEWQTARLEETITLPKSAAPTLQIPTRKHSGIHVSGWDRDEYSITACKAAAGRSLSAAEQLVKQIRLDVSSGRVTTPGPADEFNWMVYLIVRAPRESSLDLEAHDGPLSLVNVHGRVRARTENGPLSLSNCTGSIEGDVHNGPINITGNTGNYRLRAQNGPLNIHLTGDRWQGDLDASTHNGPINLRVPQTYLSAVRVDASGHSPMSCRAAQCRTAARTWDRPSRISFGSGDPVVRISTINGPVHVE